MSRHTSSELDELQRLARPYDSLGDSVVVTDKDKIILYANAATSALYGYAAGELLGKSLSMIIPKGQSPIDFELIMKAPGRIWEGEATRVRKDGTEFPALLTITPFNNLRGEIVGSVGIARDLTKLKEAEYSSIKLSQQQSVLAEIGKIVSSTLNIDEVYERFVDQVRKVIPLDRIGACILSDAGDYLDVIFAQGVAIRNRQQDDRIPFEGSIADKVMESGKGIIYDVDGESRLARHVPTLKDIADAGIRCVICVPLVTNGKSIGAHNISSLEIDGFNEDHLHFAEQVGNEIAGAVTNSKLHADLRRESHDRIILAEIGRIISSSLDIKKVYERFSEVGQQLIPHDRIGISMVTEDRASTTETYASGHEVPEREIGTLVDMDKSISGEVYRQRSGLIFQPIDSRDVESRFPGLGPSYESGLRSFLAAPLISHDIVIGVLHIDSKLENAYSYRDMRTCELVAAQIAGAIASARLHADVQQDAKEREVLAEIGRIASSSLDLSDVYERIADQVRRLISFDKATIYLVDEKKGTIVASHSAGLEVEERPVGKIESIHGSMTNDAFQSASSVLVQTEDEAWFAEHYPVAIPSFKAGLRSFISVPLISDDRVIGALSISSTTPNAYGPRDVAAAEQITTQISGAVASSQYYVQRQEAEAALGESTELYRTLLESAPDGVIITTESGRIELVNARVEAMFGYSRNELIGQKVEILVPDQARGEHYKVRTDYEKKPRARRMGGRLDTTGLRKDGSEFAVDITLSPLRTDRGLLVTGIIRDATEMRHLEEQLLHSQKMEAVGQLAGGVAHDFNNMLSAIISYTHLAQMKSPKYSQMSEYLDEVRKAAERASNLTRQLLAFSRRQIVEPRDLNINDIVLELNNMLRRLIGEDIEIVMLPNPDLGITRVDPGQMEQVIMNLAVNSRDAMPNGGKLTISTFNFTIDDENTLEHSVKEKGEYVGLKVEDTGVGMSEEVKAHIFEPFYTTKEVGNGTGLGLSICYGIAEQNGGCISVESEVGKGTSITMLLPRLMVENARFSDLDELDQLPQGKEKILLVEDEPMVREVTAHVLREQGYTVLEAANGVEAVNAVSEQSILEIDLLLTDVVMPLMSGRELAEKVKQMHPGIKVLYASGYTDDEIVRREIMTDDRQFIMKPFNPHTLTIKVREALDRLHPVG